MKLADSFYELFQGRADAYGICWDDPPRCARALGPDGFDWKFLLDQHLYDGRPIGVYPLRPEDIGPGGPTRWFVRWGCSDFDKGYTESWPDAVNVGKVLRTFGVSSWLERSRAKGWHLWVFANEWVPAALMRKAFLAAHQIAGVEAKEVNPKAEGFEDPSTLGNFVRLPYPQGSGGNGCQEVLPSGAFGHFEWRAVSPLTVEAFVRDALASRVTVPELEVAAALYRAPKPARQVHLLGPLGPHADAWMLSRRLGAVARLAFDNGPRTYDDDRSAWLMRFVHLCRESRLEPDEALVLLRDVDARFGKFSQRPDCEVRLTQMIERAYEKGHGQ